MGVASFGVRRLQGEERSMSFYWTGTAEITFLLFLFTLPLRSTVACKSTIIIYSVE